MPHQWEAKWKDEGRLGHGGQGLTHRVTLRAEPKQGGVLKYLKNNRDPVARGRMLREVASLRSLAPVMAKVPAVLDDNMDSVEDLAVELYLVMEHIPGETLKSIVETRDSLPVDQSLAVTLDLCKTVAIAHRENVLHRDLKPDNIIIRSIDPAADAVIIDYGLSFNKDSSNLTETEETFRNKFLDLPETNTPDGDRRDKRSDVSAVCALLSYMLTGERPGQLTDSAGRPPHLRGARSIREKLKGDARLHEIELYLSRGFAIPLENRFQSIEELTARIRSLQERTASGGEANPFVTATSLTEELRRRDRKTRVVERQQQATNVLVSLTNKVSKMRKDLGLFPATLSQGGREIEMLDGMDALTGPFTLQMQATNHKLTRSRVYRIGLRGDQCVVLAADVITAQGKSTLGDPKELAWYESDTTGAEVELEREIKGWFDRKMRELFDEIVAG